MTAPDPAPSWDELIHWRLVRGEQTALGELYDRFAPLVHGLAGRILDDRQAAEQLTREVFAQLWQHPETFDPAQGSLRAWLGSLTHRRAIDLLRLRPPEDRTTRVRHVIGTLSEDVHQAIAAGWFDGLTYRETADRFGISEQAVKERMHTGLTLLAEALEHDEEHVR